MREIVPPLLFAVLCSGCVSLTPPWADQDDAAAAQQPGGEGGQRGADRPATSDVAGPRSDAVPAEDSPSSLQDAASTVGTGDGASGVGGAAGSDAPLGGAGGAQSSSSGGSSETGDVARAGGAIGSGGTTGATGVGGTVGSCLGSATLDAGQDATLSQNLLAYYACDQASTTQLIDSSGNKQNASLMSDSSSTGSSFGGGKVGNALRLVKANKGYARLPADLLARVCDLTIATWVYLNSHADWQRVWNFSNDSTPGVFMFLATSSSLAGRPRFGITLHDNAAEQMLDSPTALPTKVWKHFALVLSASGATLYIDGAKVASSASVTLRPADLGSPLGGYMGRSHYTWDPYFDGNLDEFRVYGRALSPVEIKALYTGS